MYMKKFLPILPIIIGLLVAGFLFWNIVPKKITVGDVTFETILCPRMFAFNQTTTLMQIKDKNQVKGIFIGCGSKESAERTLNAVADLKASGFNAKGYISEGTAHEFLTWRRCLYEMAPMLFK